MIGNRAVMTVVVLVGLAFAAARLAAFGPQAQARTAPAPAAVKQGQKLYTDAGCYQCHGRQAQGAVSGPRLAPRPMPYDAFARYVRRPTAQMPPFTAKVLSDRDLADVYAFLESIPAPPPVTALPLLAR